MCRCLGVLRCCVVLCDLVWCYPGIVALCGGPLCIHGRGLNVSLQLVLQPLSTHIHIIITIIGIILLVKVIIFLLVIVIIILVCNTHAPVYHVHTY